MKDDLFKMYIYLLIVIALINAILGTALRFYPNTVLEILLMFATMIEIPLIVLSLFIIFHIRSKKMNDVYLVLPIFYLVLYTILAIYGGVTLQNGINPFDLSYFPNAIGYVITELFYAFQIIFGIYLLKKK